MGTQQSMRYMFVDCPNPQKAKLQRAKGSKSEARAHVTKEFHRRVRLERLQGFKQEQSPTLPTLALAVAEVKKEAITPDGCEDFLPSLQVVKQNAEDESESAVILRDISNKFIWSMLSQSRSDPFNCLPVQDLPKYMQRVLDHALTHTWPATIPTRGKALDNPINAAWLRSCMEYPVVFHAFLYAAALHLLVATKGCEDTESVAKLRFAHYSQTIKLVYEHIANLQGPPPDALIMAVTTLAVHGRPDGRSRPPCHPKSPLAEQQYFHVYGQILAAKEHVPALKTLIENKGGLKAITTYGMAETIELADIYFATLYFKKPGFELLEEPKSLIESGKLVMDSLATELNSELTSGFQYLQSCCDGPDLLEALEWMREVTLGLDQHQRRASGAPDMVDIIPVRNAAQHKVLSLCSSILSADSVDTSNVYICRIATLIYSDMVVFPQPEAQGVKVRRAINLREAFEYHFEHFGLNHHANTLIWATVLGAIGTSFTPGQVWFLRRLRWQASELAIDNWESLQQICSKLLWWRPVCDEPGQRIWNDMLAHSTCGTYGQEIG